MVESEIVFRFVAINLCCDLSKKNLSYRIKYDKSALKTILSIYDKFDQQPLDTP